MLKVHDGRDKNEIRLCDLEDGKFFIWNDCIFRRTNLDGLHITDDDEKVFAMLMTTGEITKISRENWVEPIPDRQIYLEIED